MNKLPLVIYHKNCDDGFGAAWAAYRKFGADGAEYLPMNYNNQRVCATDGKLTFPVDIATRDIYILDFSFKPEIIDAMLTIANYVTWIDHHKTAFEDFNFDPTKRIAHCDNELNWDVILDPNKSGCVLAWEYFHPGVAVPEMLLLIQDRDLWKWELDHTRDFATGLRSKSFSFEWFDRADNYVNEVISNGAAMNELFDQQLFDITARPVPVRLYIGEHAHIGWSVNCTPQFSSEGGGILAKRCGAFGMTWCIGEKGQVNVSLRSIDDYDVSVIAKAFGGGGHRNAAGFKTSFDKLKFNNLGELEVRA